MPDGVTPVSSYGKRAEYDVKEYDPVSVECICQQSPFGWFSMVSPVA